METLLTIPFLTTNGMSAHHANSSRSSSSSSNGSESTDYSDEQCFSQTFPTFLLQDVKYEPCDGEYSPPSRSYYEDSKYSEQFQLTQLMTYRPHSDSEDSPAVMDAAGLMESHNEQEHYLVTEPVPPVHVAPVEMDEAELTHSHAEDYRNLSTITPTLFLPRSYGQQEHPSPNEADTNGHAATPISETPNLGSSMRECPKCASFTSRTWYPDGTGHLLCDNCVTYVSVTPAPQPKSKPKNQRRTGLKKNLNQICANCRTDNTSLWRRDARSNTVCNACGLYYKLHGSDRPLNMRKDSIQKRKRKPKKANNEVHIEISNIRSTNAPYPPPYNSNHTEISDHRPISNGIQTLPSVHSADGFPNPLIHFVSSHRPMSPTSVTSIFNGPVCNYDVYSPSGGLGPMGFAGSPNPCSLPPTPPPSSSALSSLLVLREPYASYPPTTDV